MKRIVKEKFAQEFTDILRRKVIAIRSLQAVLNDELLFHQKAQKAGIHSPLAKSPDDYRELMATLQHEIDVDLGKN